jgi:hypothetical protein
MVSTKCLQIRDIAGVGRARVGHYEGVGVDIGAKMPEPGRSGAVPSASLTGLTVLVAASDRSIGVRRLVAEAEEAGRRPPRRSCRL